MASVGMLEGGEVGGVDILEQCELAAIVLAGS